MDVITEELMDGPPKTILYVDDSGEQGRTSGEVSEMGENAAKEWTRSDLAADGSVDQAVKSRDSQRKGASDSNKAHNALQRRVLSKTYEGQIRSAEMRILRWACGWTRLDRIRNKDVTTAMQTAPVQLKMREQRLCWFGHVLRRPQNHPVGKAMEFEAQGKRPRGAPKKRWWDLIKKDLAEANVMAEDTINRVKRRRLTSTPERRRRRSERCRQMVVFIPGTFVMRGLLMEVNSSLGIAYTYVSHVSLLGEMNPKVPNTTVCGSGLTIKHSSEMVLITGKGQSKKRGP
ncbi:unnamed protein product [Haemonchus placei]|uniref:Reverse transcriptase domain-containing protein n=1 Tax=Haemonchus placei TaxID=6290 RepID=A0A0N4XAV6_HAEPC|nr:unnamed protein product [Haemonchus placei]